MEINERIVKIRGGIYIPDSLDRTKTQKIVGELQIENVAHPDNFDGTYDEVYYAKFIGETAFTEGSGVILSKDRRSQSKQLRWELQRAYDELGIETEFDEFYEKFMTKLRANLPEVFNFLKTKE